MSDPQASFRPPRPRRRPVSPRYPRALAVGALVMGCAGSTAPVADPQPSASVHFSEDDALILLFPPCPGGRCADPYAPVLQKDERQILARIRHCSASAGDRTGTVTVVVQIDEEGRAADVKVIPTDEVNPGVIDCVRSLVPAIPFEVIPHRGPRSATVEGKLDSS